MQEDGLHTSLFFGAGLLALALGSVLCAMRSDACVMNHDRLAEVKGGACKWIVWSDCSASQAACTTYSGSGSCNAQHMCPVQSYNKRHADGWFTCSDGPLGNQGCADDEDIWCTEIQNCAATCVLVKGVWTCQEGANGGLDPNSQHTDQSADGASCPPEIGF